MSRFISSIPALLGACWALATATLSAGCPLPPVGAGDASASDDAAAADTATGDPAPLAYCGDGVCEGIEADTCLEDCAPAGKLCSATSGTPTLGTCADNGCKSAGGTCKAVDTDKDGIWDDCKCQMPPLAFCGDGVCEGIEADTCPADCAPAGKLCSATSGTPTLGTCADNGCKKAGGTCKAIDTDKDGIWDDCHCAMPAACCGDGICDAGEAELCPQDCGQVGTTVLGSAR